MSVIAFTTLWLQSAHAFSALEVGLYLLPLTGSLLVAGLFVALLNALGQPEPWRRRLRPSFGVPRTMAAKLPRLSAPRGPEDFRLDPEIRTAAERHDHDALAAILCERLGFDERRVLGIHHFGGAFGRQAVAKL